MARSLTPQSAQRSLIWALTSWLPASATSMVSTRQLEGSGLREALDRIHKATNNIPLVLHGGTGIPDDMIAKAISLGVSKININTECQLVFAEATRKYIEEGKDPAGQGLRPPRKLLAPGAKAIEAKCKEKIELFGCAGLERAKSSHSPKNNIGPAVGTFNAAGPLLCV